MMEIVFLPKTSCGSCARMFGELLGALNIALVRWMRILSSLVMSSLEKGAT